MVSHQFTQHNSTLLQHHYIMQFTISHLLSLKLACQYSFHFHFFFGLRTKSLNATESFFHCILHIKEHSR